MNGMQIASWNIDITPQKVVFTEKIGRDVSNGRIHYIATYINGLLITTRPFEVVDKKTKGYSEWKHGAA